MENINNDKSTTYDMLLGRKTVEYLKQFEGTGVYNDIAKAIQFGFHLDEEITNEMGLEVEEPKQETLEEAAEKEFPLIDTEWCRTDACEEENLHLLGHRKSFIKGAKWQIERMYSEEEVFDLLYKRDLYLLNRDEEVELELPNEWFEQFKKK